MAVKVNKPILVTGIGLSFLLWLGESLHHQLLNIGEWGLLGLMAMGTGVWWWRGKTPQKPIVKPVFPLTLADVNQEIHEAQTILDSIVVENPNQDVSHLQIALKQLPHKINDQTISLGLLGSQKTGKTTLKNLLSPQTLDDQISFIEIPYQLTEDDNHPIDADLVLFLITGDLSESQWQKVQQLHQSHRRCLILFNKQDQYLSDEKILILQQIKARVKSIIPDEDVMAINAAQTRQKVRQYRQDGSTQEWQENHPPKIDPLITRLQYILAHEKQPLIWGKVWREAINIKQQGQDILNQIRRDRALPIIEQYQWIAAATAFANPVSALDLLVTAAINTQMVVDLSDIYQQKFTLSQGQAASVEIGKLMVKLGFVELSTHAISGLLKSNAVTYVAGGATQGVSAAYLTRIAGLSLVEYFQAQDSSFNTKSSIDLDTFSEQLKQVFERTKRAEILQNFVKQAIPRLS